MSRKPRGGWVKLTPPFSEKGAAYNLVRHHARQLKVWLESGALDADQERKILEASLERAISLERPTALRALLYILSDLARQRWEIRLNDEDFVEVRPAAEGRQDPGVEKSRVRKQELVKRDEQLRHPATRKFIAMMEQSAMRSGRVVSIFSLMRDGRQLATSLRALRLLPKAQRVDALLQVIDPYLAFVDDVALCEHTGFRLQDIWRYFRHTWTNQYTSTPGRSMAFLIRDRSQENHPVIGIGALGSPIVQIRERDAWIGWHPEAFLELAEEAPSAELGAWLLRTVDDAVTELFVEDFIEEGLLGPADLRAPRPAVLARLARYGDEQRALHHRLTNPQELKRGPPKGAEDTDEHWRSHAKSHLYRSKRALTLADMLGARAILTKYLGVHPTADEVRELMTSAEGRKVVARVLRKAKGNCVGIAMADITVCGAIAPYNALLGGKLVSMLAASPETVCAYRDRYIDQESEIASSMAGRAIVRSSKLVLLGTTSLYGVGSSQYNRLRVPTERLGGRIGEQIEYLELGKSDAYGTSHFSASTVDALVSLVQQSANGQRVNSIFGEGVSPKLRKIREGLEALNLPADDLLQHGRQRIVYGVPVVRNVRQFLLGMDQDPDYMFDLARPQAGTDAIARWWAERWLSERINRDEALAQVAAHTLVRPIRHGARVTLPEVDDGQSSLFDDAYTRPGPNDR